jgi:hypothetical protein
MDDFLEAIFQDSLAPDRRLAVFILPGPRVEFFDNLPAAAQYARSKQATHDVYFGVALMSPTTTGRGQLEHIVSLSCLWVDLDLAGPAHPGHALPPTLDDAQALLQGMPYPPSITVDSGHGLHAYWLFQEPLSLETPADREAIRALAKGWHGRLCTLAERQGWTVENLGDPTRVLRLPDTTNHKLPGQPVPVRLLEFNPQRRYDPGDLELVLPEPVAVEPAMEPVQLPEFSDQPPQDKFAAAWQECPRFRATWDRQRDDLSDQSASAYDLSLATIAALRGWSDAEIGSLLFAWRNHHHEQPHKIRRQDYLARTLRLARQNADPAPDSVDLTGLLQIIPAKQPPEPTAREQVDPGALPESFCRIPGFVSEVMDHCLETAPYPNVPLAFCGALALQALLAGRKVRDEADNRTNLYLLALAYSSAGKDWPRKLNVKILHRVGLINCLGDKFASGEGIQDALFLNPAMLFQNDEIDGLLQSISKSRDARYENLMGTLLTMYSSANSVYPMRRKAGRDESGVIDQPCLVVFGTAIPTHYYSALSERMLTNGFFARMLIVDTGRRSDGQEPGILTPSERILSSARWWADFQPTPGNLQPHHPDPYTVPATPAARDLLIESRIAAGRHYSRAESRGDAVGTTVWGRAQEQIRKLALLYAVSENHTHPQISEAAVHWASAIVNHLTHRMLFMANCHLSESEFDQRCKRVLEALQAWRREHGDTWMSFRDLARKFRWSRRDHDEIRTALADQDRIETNLVATGGRPKLVYRLKPLP